MSNRSPENEPEVISLDDELDERLTRADQELLRHALVEHGKRLGAIEAKLDAQMDDLMAIRLVIGQTNERMQKLVEKLKEIKDEN